jgi:PBP1b-binding outer membrane lipoprotein LpoB
MKKFKFVLSATLVIILLNSCSSVNGLFYDGRLVQRKNPYQSFSENDKLAKTVVGKSEDVKYTESTCLETTGLNAVENSYTAVQANDVSDFASNSNQFSLSPEKNQPKQVFNSNVSFKAPRSISKLEKASKLVMKQKHTSLKEKRGGVSIDSDQLLLVILCLFIPPLAVYLFEGGWSTDAHSILC